VHIFYINLRTRPDRRAFMERQAARLGLTMERVEAVTPADIPQNEIAAAPQWLGKGELACSYSHRAIWRMIVSRGLPAALVLEDDCALSLKAPTVLADPDLMSPGIDMLQFETHPSSALLGRELPTRVASISKRRMLSSCLGTCGYIITPEMAKRCIDHPDLPKMDLGKFLFSRNGPQFLYGHRLFQTFPALATPIGALVPETELKQSDVDQTRLKRDPSLARPEKRRKSASAKMAETLRHAGLSLEAFGLGELLSARYVDIPFDGDAGLGHAILQEDALTIPGNAAQH